MPEPSKLAYAIAQRLRADHVRCELDACPLSRVWPEDVQEVLDVRATLVDDQGNLTVR